MNEHPKPHSPGGQRTGRVESNAAGKVAEQLRGRQAGGVRPEAGGTAGFLTSIRNDQPGDADDDGYLDDPATSGDEWRVQRVYVNGQGQLGQIVKVVVYDYTGGNTTATPYYYGYDVLGNVSVISGDDGQQLDQFEQDAFGNLVSGNWSTRVGNITEQITTKQYDVDLGLYYFSARWYDPLSGAFVSRDPYSLESSDGGPAEASFRPDSGARQSCTRGSIPILEGGHSLRWKRHTYGLASSNVINAADPTGLWTLCCPWISAWPPWAICNATAMATCRARYPAAFTCICVTLSWQRTCVSCCPRVVTITTASSSHCFCY